MGGTTGLFLFAVLCLCLQLYSCARIAGRCTLGGRYNEVKTLIKRNGYPRSTRIQLPCRYRMLNVRCNGVATEVFADNSYDSVEDSPYATGVFANITTVNDDGSVTFQQLFLNNVTFKAYLDEGNLTRSPWQWTYTGSVVDDNKKIVGAYDATTKRGVLTSSGITVTFLYVGPTRFRRFVKESTLTIAMKCDEDTFSSVGNGYPQSVCGSPNNTYEVMEATQKELKLDFHHRVRELGYLLFGKQNAKQPDPVCQEAVDIGGACPDLGERMYACKNLYNARIICLRNNNMNPLKLYVTCMRILCNTDKARSNDTCSTLREAISACGPFDNHVNIVELNSRAGCPAPAALPPPETTTQSYWYNRNGGPQSECVDKDRAFSTRYGHESRTTSAVDTFFTRQMTFELPCRYKMANIKCGDQRTQIYVDRDNSVDGYSYVSGVSVKVKTTNAQGQVVEQTNKLSNDKFKEFLAQGDLSKRLWRWSYSGSKKPRKADRLLGSYNQTTNSGELRSGQLTVTYAYTDPLNATRPGGALLTIRCDDPEFKGLDSYPDTLCGSPADHYYKSLEGLGAGIPSDPHHTHFRKDAIILAQQNVKQPKSVCRETTSIVKSGSCDDLGDKLYACHQMLTSRTSWSFEYTYHACVVENKIDLMKVFISCLRVMCATEKPTSQETCQPLQQVYSACGDLTPKMTHTKMSQLLALSDCPAVASNVTTLR